MPEKRPARAKKKGFETVQSAAKALRRAAEIDASRQTLMNVVRGWLGETERKEVANFLWNVRLALDAGIPNRFTDRELFSLQHQALRELRAGRKLASQGKEEGAMRELSKSVRTLETFGNLTSFFCFPWKLFEKTGLLTGMHFAEKKEFKEAIDIFDGMAYTFFVGGKGYKTSQYFRKLNQVIDLMPKREQAKVRSELAKRYAELWKSNRKAG